ncbi:TspO/MBR family protein [Arthrobacter cryoconiti]|uniref:TspO/MBR family protein n=1 Tax=Arthrobacter cryoconiti TaxID=748907 RepID=A0ABV8QXR0_9MICC|nr:TspO/MBR family protein [Arthrobacter cryoconiti]MCC9067602.1 tryptophan-rich sensory protein [Arthrobacter cryoconiti]
MKQNPGGNDRFRQVVVALSAVIAVVGSFIGSGAAGGTQIQNASNGALGADSTLIAPYGPAFSIWSVIYLGLVAYAVWQFLPAQIEQTRHRLLGYPIAASLILNAVWILSIQFDLLWLSVPVIVVLLAVLAGIFVLLLRNRPTSTLDAIITDGTMGLYLGWVCVATAANVSAVLVAAGFQGFGLSPTIWAVVVLAVATVVGIALAMYGRGRLSPATSLCWGLVWVAVARLTGELLSTPTAVAALIGAALVLIVTVVVRLRIGASTESTLSRLGG